MPKTTFNSRYHPLRRKRLSPALTLAKPWLLLLFLLLNQLNIAVHAQEHDAHHVADCQVCVQLHANGHAPTAGFTLPVFAPAIIDIVINAGFSVPSTPVYLTPVPRAPPVILL